MRNAPPAAQCYRLTISIYFRFATFLRWPDTQRITLERPVHSKWRRSTPNPIFYMRHIVEWLLCFVSAIVFF